MVQLNQVYMYDGETQYVYTLINIHISGRKPSWCEQRVLAWRQSLPSADGKLWVKDWECFTWGDGASRDTGLCRRPLLSLVIVIFTQWEEKNTVVFIFW